MLAIDGGVAPTAEIIKKSELYVVDNNLLGHKGELVVCRRISMISVIAVQVKLYFEPKILYDDLVIVARDRR